VVLNQKEFGVSILQAPSCRFPFNSNLYPCYARKIIAKWTLHPLFQSPAFRISPKVVHRSAVPVWPPSMRAGRRCAFMHLKETGRSLPKPAETEINVNVAARGECRNPPAGSSWAPVPRCRKMSCKCSLAPAFAAASTRKRRYISNFACFRPVVVQ